MRHVRAGAEILIIRQLYFFFFAGLFYKHKSQASPLKLLFIKLKKESIQTRKFFNPRLSIIYLPGFGEMSLRQNADQMREKRGEIYGVAPG